jgi:hypothetical protein
MGKTNVQDKVIASQISPIADSVYLQILVEPLGHPGHHVGQQGSRQSVQSPMLPVVRGASHHDLAVSNGYHHIWVERAIHFPLGSLHRYVAALHIYLHTFRNGDRHATYA